ncbi:MAG: tetratricopeptide repeat protein [Thermoplasmata archaeon]|nr:tetratricopeptide repeat protein [Thermoplasmata archaeon]
MPALHLPPPFVARERELEFLTQKIERARANAGSTVFIAGESGVGKTRLVEELIAVAETRGFQVFRGQCFLESLAPYGPMSMVLKEAGLDHLLTETKPPKIEAVYAVKKGGIIIAKQERREAIDSDIFMGMVTAVETFVKDSLAQMQQSVVSEQTGHMGYGNFFITNVPGRLLNLVAVTTGRENEYLISDLREMLDAIEREFGEAVGSHEGEQIRGIEENLRGLFLGGKYEGIDYAEDDARLRQANLFENVLRGVQRKAEQKPVLIFIDDLQWSDPSSLAMLHYIARNTRKNAVLIVGAYRSEEIVAISDGKVHPLVDAMEKMEKEGLVEKVELKRLDLDGCHAVICSVLGSEIEKEFSEKLYRETEGNTFFLVEILKNLYEEKQVRFEAGTWEYNLETLRIPARIYELVVRRLERLAKEERELLDAASVVGEEFTSELLAGVAELSRVQVVKMLVAIERVHKLIRALKEKYRFEHAKIREVLYAELPDELKTIYHGIAAKILEEEYRRGKTGVVEDIVYHCQKAGLSEKVIEYGLPAGKLAKQRFANDEAIKFYRAVLESMGEKEGYGELKLQVLDELVEVLEVAGVYEEALNLLKLKITNTITGKPVEAGKAYQMACEIYTRKGDFDKAIEAAEQSEMLLRALPMAELELARTISAKGRVFEMRCEYEKALECQQNALAVFEGLQAEKDIANALHRMGVVHWCRGEYEKALEFYKKSLDLREKLGDMRGISASYNNIGNVYYAKGEYERALEGFTKSLALQEKLGDVWGIAVSYNNTGIVYDSKGEYEKALEGFTKSLELREKLGDMRGISASYNNIGVVYALKGEYEKAMEFYKKSLNLREKLADMWGVAGSYSNIGIVYTVKGEYEKAMECHKKSHKIALEIGDKSTLTNALVRLAECSLYLGDFDACKSHLAKAKKIVEETGEKPKDAEMGYVSGKLLAAEGKLGEAVAELERAVGLYETMGKADVDYHKAVFELGKVKKDRALLEKALGFFERIGNKVWAERVRGVLR